MGSILIVGGSDPSRGAGVDVDRELAESFGATVRVVVTANTDQDEREVRAVGARAPAEWLAEAQACFASESGGTGGAGDIEALKFGLLPGADHVAAAAELVRAVRDRDPQLPIVVDPIIASSSGFTFLDGPGLVALRTELVPEAVVLTPNLPEAARLAGLDVKALVATREARVDAARVLLRLGARAVLVKGGHGEEDPVVDLILEQAEPERWIEHPRAPGPGIRGSGCRYATTIAVHLARGDSLETAATAAAELVAGHIRAAS